MIKGILCDFFIFSQSYCAVAIIVILLCTNEKLWKGLKFNKKFEIQRKLLSSHMPDLRIKQIGAKYSFSFWISSYLNFQILTLRNPYHGCHFLFFAWLYSSHKSTWKNNKQFKLIHKMFYSEWYSYTVLSLLRAPVRLCKSF